LCITGDYFDPAFTQVDRVLEVSWPDDLKKRTADEEEGLKLEDVGVVMDKADDEGLGRQFLIKWGNTPYSEATYEFERDLIFCDVDYKSQVIGFLRRNNKPAKKDRNEASRKGETGKRELSLVFSEKIKRDGTEHQVAAEQYQKKLQEIVFKNGGQLRDYQAEGVAWMLSNYVNNRSSILADGECPIRFDLFVGLRLTLAILLYRDGFGEDFTGKIPCRVMYRSLLIV
jgi:SNF2 family DNA or RNA helicase